VPQTANRVRLRGLSIALKFSTNALPAGMCSVIELPVPGKRSRYLAGFANFAVITQYNRSIFYATAVLDLADAVRAARTRQFAGSDAGIRIK